VRTPPSRASYCWFTAPSGALCLKLAGTPHADRPLAGICGSARCPASHPPAGLGRARHTDQTFLGSLGPARKTERARLQADHHRALAVESGVDHTAFYGTRPHRSPRRVRTAPMFTPAGCDQPDPRDAQITRLKTEITGLKNRVVESTSTINELTEFQAQALARLAAQDDEIIRLRAAATSASRVSRLPQRPRPGRLRSGVGVQDKRGRRPRYDGNRRPVILS
jgi:hypothetical protein